MVGRYDGLMVTTDLRRSIRSTFRPSNHITILPFLHERVQSGRN